jgi:hypothetical protein
MCKKRPARRYPLKAAREIANSWEATSTRATVTPGYPSAKNTSLTCLADWATKNKRTTTDDDSSSDSNADVDHPDVQAMRNSDTLSDRKVRMAAPWKAPTVSHGARSQRD